ncbi:hypothetical protein ACOQH3_001461 [Yersinia enterocolitica]
MHRIDTPTAQVDKFGAGKNGFTRGNPQTGVPATALDDDYFDAVQEDIANVIESTGTALKKSDRAQLLTAINAIVSGAGRDFLKKANNLSEIKYAGLAAVAAALANLSLSSGLFPIEMPFFGLRHRHQQTFLLKCLGRFFYGGMVRHLRHRNIQNSR